MNKLYDQSTTPPVTKLNAATEQHHPWKESAFEELKVCVEGYCSAGALYDSVASESYTLVDHKNKNLYNAYATLLAEKMGVSMPALKAVSTESLNSDGSITVNSEIALEGWIGTLWEKIKGLFTKTYQAVQSFFKKHFVRLGKTKKALLNLQSVLEKTQKDFTNADTTAYSGGLYKRYAGYGNVNASSVKTSLANVGRLNASIGAVNKSAEVMAKTHMVDKDFFTKIKSLRDQAADNDSAKQDIDENTPGKMAALVSSDKRKDRSAKKDESKTLGEISQAAKGEAASMDGEVSNLGSNDEGGADENMTQAKKQMAGFLEEVKKALDVGLNTNLISGMQIKKVTITEALELEVETGVDENDAATMVLAAKSDLLLMIKSALALLEKTEAGLTQYGEINDVVMKNLSTVDSLVKDIDKIDPEKYGQYKKLINEQVRERLQMMRRFFSAYNKVGKNILDLSMDAAEGVVEYGVLSVKHYS